MFPRILYGLLFTIPILITTTTSAPVEDTALEDLSPKARDIILSARKIEPSTIKDQDESISDQYDADVQSVHTLKTKKKAAGPHWVVYADEYISGKTGPPKASDITGYNVFSISFLLLAGPWDKAQEWTDLTAAERASIKAEYAAAGIKLIVSCFGATDAPTSSGANATTTANTFAAWVKKWGMDGIDVDYEDFNAFDAQNGSAENWLIEFTSVLRAALPAPDYLLTHAPVAPWFSPTKYAGGGYLKVHESVGGMIDWYNIQFYNQGTNEYTTCDNLLLTSSSTWAQTAVFQIIANGVPPDKLVIGKPARSSDASNGYIAPATLATCLETAKATGWTGGAMVWQYPYATKAWISTVRSQSWPV